ncbi:MAG: hypothetical protein IKW64_00720 [Clostridia bacterium]|nr:hypothetical protein [Clostridia bacterium]
MKIAYIGIDLFYPALEALEALDCEILEIFTCETDNITEFNVKITDFAVKRNIPCKKSRITKDDIARLLQNGCEAAICGGYYFKIPADTKLPIVNIHPSLLPVGRGSWPMALSILRGDKKSGITIHKIAEGFDTGNILLQREFEIADDETHKTFMEKANSLLPEMLESLIKNFALLWQNAKPQGEGEYWEMPAEEKYTVTYDMTVKEADRILRAFYGYECIYKTKDRRTLIIGGRAVKSYKTEGAEFPLVDGYIKIQKNL